jgi:putative tricarboxylic transport membrane protein
VAVAHGGVGPKVFPYLVGSGLVLVGLVALREARGGRLAPTGALEVDLAPVALVAGGLILQAVALEPLGWIPSTTVLFMAGARAFGARRLLVDLALGLVLSVATFLLFDLALGLDLPVGDLFGA